MKPKVYLSPESFYEIAMQLGKTVIETEKIMLTGHMYVVTGVDYVYYTYTSELIELPKSLEVISAKEVHF